jgi:hypothetical protein
MLFCQGFFGMFTTITQTMTWYFFFFCIIITHIIIFFFFFGYLYQRTLHGYYDCALNEILPGICSIILDAILLNVNCSARMRHEFYVILGEPPNEFHVNNINDCLPYSIES